MSAPFVSCILPTYDRRMFFAQSIDYFLRQDYPHKELIIVDDGTDCIADLVPNGPPIRYIRLNQRHTVGAKRNLACGEASGDIILHWDDDDWMADWRITYQVDQLSNSSADICGLDRLLYYEQSSQRAWEYIYPPAGKTWVAGNTLCYRKSFWQRHPFLEINIAEDARFVWQAERSQVLRLDNPSFIVGLIHGGNVSPKVTAGSYWNPRPISVVHELIGDDRRFYEGGIAPKGTALVAASLGVGDILRMTPLIRALHLQGYEVDALLEPDYAEAAQLLEGAREIRSVFYRTSTRVTPRQERLSGLAERNYDVAVFSFWAAPLQALVSARQKIVFDRADWLKSGDSHCVETIARQLGWQGDMPQPFAVASKRKFDLAPNTVALHVGCKPDWPWKKWHGFDDLANLLPDVVLIGTATDLNNAGTYFQHAFRWPHHVKNYIGELNLPDTAALLSQCAALVSNDSGIMHLGTALNIPTLGVFGITSPDRERIPAPNMFPITKGLPCEPECRKQAWGRRDCQYHLRCLKELTAVEVHARLREILPERKPVEQVQKKTNITEVNPVQRLSLAYHGHVFDASGYGNAARAYIHALHSAGVELSVMDLSRHRRQVSDELVESLVDRDINPDFHLFHAIPHVFAQQAFRVRNAIAMTVWETDTMPTQWRNILNHALEVWLPCDFNIAAFRDHVAKLAKLPHAVMPRNGHEPLPGAREFLGVDPEDFVVYSIFEWQDRKCPMEQMKAHLRAFSGRDRAVLILKSNPGAAQVAQQALTEARRQVPSDARIELRCEAWTDTQIAALQERGDCYLSLHRGEGWCYPLFEAACKGVPVVATAYSGPLEYLDPAHHQLVPYQLISVRQPYMYYHPRMNWAEPDLNEAASRLRWVYENRDAAKHKAVEAAVSLNRRYAPEEIGRMARSRLLDLLRRTNRARYQQVRSAESRGDLRPTVPIPGAWYDADYFEHGIKSNWESGYRWELFRGLFRDAASYITNLFPGVASILDAGCAKGFLVRALREQGKEAWGFDASPWAIDQADSESQPHVRLAGVDDYMFDQQFDLLVAFDLFAHLTQEQVEAFLKRARGHVRVGILAIIATYDQAGDPNPEDRDLSHITRQPREWWRERFLAAGWTQDAMHQNLEQLCQRHEVPTRMGWQVYVYSPV
jgi:ADP-heptose:LPS heptosyltransferase/2-polyprenyl-3-methyl-5-hydroxy-6-metoxy-1,4-benzoquinol methylase